MCARLIVSNSLTSKTRYKGNDCSNNDDGSVVSFESIADERRTDEGKISLGAKAPAVRSEEGDDNIDEDVDTNNDGTNNVDYNNDGGDDAGDEKMKIPKRKVQCWMTIIPILQPAQMTMCMY